MTAPIERSAFGPVTAGGRIEAVDIVRGFALWGVLLVNMWSFTWPFPHLTPSDPFAEWALIFLFREKSWHLFSFLFGLGFALQMERASDHGAVFLLRYVRRLAVLAAFGFLSYAAWRTDILTNYAELGLALLLFRRASPRLLLIVASLLLAAAPINVAVRSMIPSDPEVAAEVAGESSRKRQASFDAKEELARVRMTGSVIAVAIAHARSYGEHADLRSGGLDPDGFLPRFAMMLLGSLAGKRRIFQQFERHRALIRRVFFWGLPLGLLAMTAVLGIPFVVPPLARGFWGVAAWSYGTTVMALSYAAGLVILVQLQQWKRMLAPLGAMGRMALTVYLSQSIVFPLLFFGFGFGQLGRVGSSTVWAYAALMFAANMAFCVWWMKRFRFGPVEWLWRTLSYLRLQPMRLPRKTEAVAEL